MIIKVRYYNDAGPILILASGGSSVMAGVRDGHCYNTARPRNPAATVEIRDRRL